MPAATLTPAERRANDAALRELAKARADVASLREDLDTARARATAAESDARRTAIELRDVRVHLGTARADLASLRDDHERDVRALRADLHAAEAEVRAQRGLVTLAAGRERGLVATVLRVRAALGPEAT